MVYDLVIKLLAGVIRTVLAAIIGGAMARGILRDSVAEELMRALDSTALQVAGFFLVVLWSVWQKYGSHKLTLKALDLPRGTEYSALKDVSKRP